MISYGRQSIDKQDINAVIKVLKSDFITQGPTIEKFEKNLKLYFKSKFAVAVSSGTAALNLIAEILKWKKNDIQSAVQNDPNPICHRASESTQEALNSLLTHCLSCFQHFWISSNKKN